MASIIGVETLQHTNGTTAATIDSSGRVTMNVRPAFNVGMTATKTVTSGTSNKIPYDDKTGHQFYDLQGNYSTTNYEFTAPCDGLYFFHGKLVFAANEYTRYWNLGLIVNGSAEDSESISRTRAYAPDGSGTGYPSINGTWVRELNSGDTVSLYSTWEVSQGTYDASETAHYHGSGFLGYLIG